MNARDGRVPRRHARSNGFPKSLAWAMGVFLYGLAVPVLSMANPSGPTVTAGQASISGLGTAQVTIHQQTQQAIIHWNQFNIGQHELTRFIQPSSSSIALNRIFDVNPSQIFGRLEANGSLILLNPNGILFGPNAQVNVNGLIASSLNLSNEQFLAGQYLFQGQIGNGLIKNEGQIHGGENGIFLLAPQVVNTGLITSADGNVTLGAGTTAFLSNRPDGNGLMVEVSAPAGEAKNLGEIFADGGHVSLAGFAVNQEGLIQANSVKEVNGVIELVAKQELNLKTGSRTMAKGDESGISPGGTIIALSDLSTGTTRFEPGAVIDVSGGTAGGDGGFTEVSGAFVSLGGTFRGSSVNGWRGGTLLIDPIDVTVDDSFFNGLIGSGLSEITVEAENDIMVSGFFDIGNSWLLPPNEDGTTGIGTLSFHAGNNLRFENLGGFSSFLGNFDFLNSGFDPQVLQHETGTPWNIVGIAGKDIIFTGAVLMAPAGGNLSLTAGRDISLVPVNPITDLPVDPGFGLASAIGTTQGNVSLTAGRHLRTPAASEQIFSVATSGIRLEGKGDLSIQAGGDWAGGLVSGQNTGPGFLLTDGKAEVHVPQGQIGSGTQYASLALGKADVTLNAGKSIYMGLAGDKGVSGVGSGQPSLTVDPGNRLALTASTGNIYLKPSMPNQGQDPIKDLRTFFPATFEARALGDESVAQDLGLGPSEIGGHIIVESPLTFWPSMTGNILLDAKGDLRGDPGTIRVGTGKNHNGNVLQFGPDGVPVAVSIGGQVRDERTLMQLGFTQSQVRVLLTEVFEVQPANLAQPVRVIDADIGEVQRAVQTGLFSEVQAVLGKSAQAMENAEPGILTFRAQTGSIDRLFFDLRTLAFPKNSLIEAGQDLRLINISMGLPNGTQGIIKAGRDIDMTTIGPASGILFAGRGTGQVFAGRNLNVADSLGIQFQADFVPTSLADQGGLLDIRVGGDLNMTQSRIVSWNGAGIHIRGILDPPPSDSPEFAGFFDAVGGTVNVGTSAPPTGFGGATGIMTVLGGDIAIRSRGNVEVNRSRVASFGGGNVSITTNPGNINAGFGGADELVTFLVTNQGTDSEGNPITQTFQFDVPGSGIFTFHPDDPFPVIFPKFDTPAITAMKNEKIKLDFFGRNSSSLDAQIEAAVKAREPEFNEIFLDFIHNTPIRAGDISLIARNDTKSGSVVVPPAGIRGRRIEIDSDLLDLQGGTISGLANIASDAVVGATANSFSGVTSGTVTASGDAGGGSLAPLGGSTGTVTTGASSTAGSAATTAESAQEVQEDASQSARQDARAQAQAQGVGRPEETGGTAQGGTSLSMGRGVTIEVEVKEEKNKS
jgi:filamentous hemagglutinin family protein